MKGGKQEDGNLVNNSLKNEERLGSEQIMTNSNMRRSEKEDAGAVTRNEEERAETEEDPGTSLQELD